MTKTVETVRDYLTLCVDMAKKTMRGSGSLVYHGPMDLVLQEGQQYTPAPYDPERWDGYEGTPGNCFEDALMLAMDFDELTYVEGYAIGTFGIGIHHAWCVDGDGNVVDATWATSELGMGREYLGIPFTTDYVCRAVAEKDTYGVFPEYDTGLYSTPLDRGEACP